MNGKDALYNHISIADGTFVTVKQLSERYKYCFLKSFDGWENKWGEYKDGVFTIFVILDYFTAILFGLDEREFQSVLVCTDIREFYELGLYGLVRFYSRETGPLVYLLMLNSSTYEWCIEEVDPLCRTVRDALIYRRPLELSAIPIDDVNGAEWFQQGDVCIWKKGSQSVKFMPSVLT